MAGRTFCSFIFRVIVISPERIMSEPVQHHMAFHNWRTFWWAVWSIIGTGVVVLAFHLQWTSGFNKRLREIFEGYPFYLSDQAFTPAPLAVFLLGIAITLFFTYALLVTSGFFRRTALFLTALVVIALTTPVCALWGIFFSTAAILQSMAVAGLGAVVTPLFFKKTVVPLPAPLPETEDNQPYSNP